MSIIGLLVALVVICLVYWAIVSILGAFGIGDPVATLVKVIFVIILIVWLLSQFGYGVPGFRLR